MSLLSRCQKGIILSHTMEPQIYFEYGEEWENMDYDNRLKWWLKMMTASGKLMFIFVGPWTRLPESSQLLQCDLPSKDISCMAHFQTSKDFHFAIFCIVIKGRFGLIINYSLHLLMSEDDAFVVELIFTYKYIYSINLS